jgi:hypothetical protein
VLIHRAKRANIEEIVAHEFAQRTGLFIILRIELLIGRYLFVIWPDGRICLAMLLVEDNAFLHVDGVTLASALCEFGIITNLAFEANVSDEALIRLGIEARQIASVWITIGIAICDVKQKTRS